MSIRWRVRPSNIARSRRAGGAIWRRGDGSGLARAARLLQVRESPSTWSLQEPGGGNAFDWRRYCGQLAIRVCDGSSLPGGSDEDLEDNQSHPAIARTGIVGRRADDLVALSVLRSAIYRSNGATRASSGGATAPSRVRRSGWGTRARPNRRDVSARFI